MAAFSRAPRRFIFWKDAKIWLAEGNGASKIDSLPRFFPTEPIPCSVRSHASSHTSRAKAIHGDPSNIVLASGLAAKLRLKQPLMNSLASSVTGRQRFLGSTANCPWRSCSFFVFAALRNGACPLIMKYVSKPRDHTSAPEVAVVPSSRHSGAVLTKLRTSRRAPRRCVYLWFLRSSFELVLATAMLAYLSDKPQSIIFSCIWTTDVFGVRGSVKSQS
mmetsp:Transcript_21526/g.73778  ORF Transcript_21526/g.73778 Transcript_21526/m.73778 type:complete len:218 (-) Transcript_21526:622-1275(-)